MSRALASSPAGALAGEVVAPGDKSISHRALILASQTLGTTRITGLLEGDDVLRTAKALQSLGVKIGKNGHAWEVEGVGVGGLAESRDVLDMGNAGTGARLLMGLLAPYPFSTVFTGDESLRSRPMGRVIEPLTQMGATIVAHSGDRMPLVLTGTADALPITYAPPVASAQVKSAILLAGLNTRGKTTVIEKDPTRDHTENMLRHLGFEVSSCGAIFADTKSVSAGSRAAGDPAQPLRSSQDDVIISLLGQQPQKYADREISVPGDPSSAAFMAVAALICPQSKILIRNVCINPLRIGVFVTLKEMGAKITFKNERTVSGERVTDIAVAAGRLKAVTVPPERAPSMIDEYPILAVAAAFAKGETVMHGLSELRVKESNRLNAIIEMLTACGVKARAEGDSLYVTGGAVKGGAKIHTRFDHRIAMSALVLGMASQAPVEIDDGEAIKTSFPNFVEMMNGLGARITPLPEGEGLLPLVIAIDGPAASGKGTLARRLAEHFGLEYLDTGSLYRAVGMKLVYGGKDPNDKTAALAAARNIDAEDLANPRLRQERIGQAASVVSAYPEVRQALLEFQRNFAHGKKGAVLDGRDIGTVVCPDADFKFFITATLYARAKRRHKELSGQGYEVVFDSVLEDLRERDERDSQRAIAPLKPADDATLIDTSDMDASKVFEKACDIIAGKRPNLLKNA